MGVIGVLDKKFVNAATTAEFISEKMEIPLHELVDVMAAVPKEDVAPVRHGHWNKSEGNEELTEHGFVHPDMYVCSCCGWSCCCRFKIGFKYCPNCGAKMDKE